MDAQQRLERLEGLRRSGTIYTEMEVLYKGDRTKFPVYQIDLDWLVYNKYNGRIASMVKSHESQSGPLNAEDPDHKQIIERFLWNSKEQRNRNTLKDLRENGQLKYGIVTRDGIIIDGNRRACLLNRIAEEDHSRPAYFLAVILDDKLDQNPREIMRLETTYQMGEDEKLDYNAIEKYLKCKDLKEAYTFNEKEIAKMMGETEGRIEEWLSIMKLMDEYLAFLKYDGIYTRLDDTEGIFVDINGYFGRYDGESSAMVQWQYEKQDLHDLKLIYFDYIRARHGGEGKEYRKIGKPSKKDSFFCNEAVWREFRDRHFQSVYPISDSEQSIDQCRQALQNVPLDEVLKQRDHAWQTKVLPKIKENMGRSGRAIDDYNAKNMPGELLNRARNALVLIDPSTDEFLEDSTIQPLVTELGRLVWEFQKALKHRRQDQEND